MLTLFTGCKPNYPVDQIEYAISDADTIEGKRMTMLICGPCHYNTTLGNLSGKKIEDSPVFFGRVFDEGL